MKISDWLMLLAVLLSPLLAVQVQKWIERFREKRSRKIGVFETLMATRAARLSLEHVKALNMIDLTFYGGGRSSRSKREQSVLDAWKEYLDHLYIQCPTDKSQAQNWEMRRDELFFDLLNVMATDAGYSFDRVHLKRGVYSPMAHGTLETQLNALRTSAISVLEGKAPLVVRQWVPQGEPPPQNN